MPNLPPGPTRAHADTLWPSFLFFMYIESFEVSESERERERERESVCVCVCVVLLVRVCET